MATQRTSRLQASDLPDWELRLVTSGHTDQLHARYIGTDGFKATLIVNDILTGRQKDGRPELHATAANVSVALGEDTETDAWAVACAELLTALSHAALEMTIDTRLDAEPARRRPSPARLARGDEQHAARYR